ncbi:nucleoside triphosphate pyrophosphohydrolase family protein [Pseudomonas viridiflava]|uniref:nucleoside triphosphate pyrophosphohydrolase family protein n=1 Tax=Pseudomonas viridiflava TaxID=33069 RepID=UPI000473DAB1|nr:nucleoside triphosphate pyrophosphohydrolase family protein [Pseudomonas viridiflava]
MPVPTPQLPSLSIPQYRLKAGGTNQFQTDEGGYQKLKFGYFGEVGGLLSAVKKVGRDRLAASVNDLAAEELGDALWYLINIAASVDVAPDEIGASCIAYLRSEFGESEKPPILPVTFRHIDSLMEMRRSPDNVDRSTQLARLANRAGVLAEVSFNSMRALAPVARSPQPESRHSFGRAGHSLRQFRS